MTQSSEVRHLPPVGVLSVDDLKNIPTLEGKPRLPARDQAVIGRVVVKVRLHVYLRTEMHSLHKYCLLSQRCMDKTTKSDLRVGDKVDVWGLNTITYTLTV